MSKEKENNDNSQKADETKNPDGQEKTDDITLSEEVKDDESGKETSEGEKAEGDGKKDTDKGGETSEGVKADGEGEQKVDKAQQKIDEKINKFYKEKMEEKERADALEVKLKVLEEKHAEATKVVLPEIPPIPDVLEPDFDEKMLARDEIIGKHAKASANEEALQNARQDKLRADQIKQGEANKVVIDNFEEKITELKLDSKMILESENIVSKGIPNRPELARFLLSDDNGPLNILYLSQNLAELEKIGNMHDTEAAVYIATKISPEAIKLKPKITNTPDPGYTPEGGKAVPLPEDKNLEGCTFSSDPG